MTRFVISLLARFKVTSDNLAVVHLDAARPGALLAYLAIENNAPHSRAALAEQFWPDQPQSDALASLRYTLSNLRSLLQDRQAAEPLLLLTRTEVQFNPNAAVEIDALVFEKMAKRALSFCAPQPDKEHSLRLIQTMLQDAIDLYHGPFMRDFVFGSNLALESWALGKREQLESTYQLLLQILADNFEQDSRFLEAEKLYRKLLEFNPWDENVHRRLMRVLSGSGQQGAALAHYEFCRQALGDLGVEPDWQTNQLYHQIKTAQYSRTYKSPMNLIGRKEEMNWLNDHLKRVLAMQGETLLVVGEAGSGKTALLGHFVHQAMTYHPSLLAAPGQCDAYAQMGLPYQPFIDCLHMFTGNWDKVPWRENFSPENQERLQQAIPIVAQCLVETAPALLAHFVDRSLLVQNIRAVSPGLHRSSAWMKTLEQSHPHTDKGLSSAIIYDQFKNFLIAISRFFPILLLLDDMHWADADSASLLFYLSRRLKNHRILILAAYRPEELWHELNQSDHPLLKFVNESQRSYSNIFLDLDRANEKNFVSAWMSESPHIQPHNLGENFYSALSQTTGGNPLFTIEMLTSLQARGDLRLSTEGVWETRPELNWNHLPERVEAVIAGRLELLPPTWREWLSTASIEGESFTAELIAHIHGVPVASLLQDLNGPLGKGRGAHRLVQAEGVQWLRKDTGATTPLSHFRFHHILYQTYLYQAQNPVERSHRHISVGTALEQIYSEHPDELSRRSGELARHFEAGGLFDKASMYHLRAGQHAANLGANQTAIAHYLHGVGLLSNLPFSPERDRLEINFYLALAAPFLLGDGWGGVSRQQYIQKALDLLDKYADRQWSELIPVLYSQADDLISRGEQEQAERIGHQMLLLTKENADIDRAMAYQILGFSSVFQGIFVLGRQYIEKALHAIAATSSNSPHPSDFEIVCIALLGFADAYSGFPARSKRYLDKALGYARQSRNPAYYGGVLIFASEVAYLFRDWQTLDDIVRELSQFDQAEEMQYFHAYSLSLKGYLQIVHSEVGSPEASAGLEIIKAGMNLWSESGTQLGRGGWINRLAEGCLKANRVEEGLFIVKEATKPDVLRFAQIGLSQLYRVQGELLLKQESPDVQQAEDVFLRSLEIARDQEAHSLELRTALSLAQFWQDTHPEQARQLLTDICDWFTEGQDLLLDWQTAQALLKSLSS